jgi:hypothetical protein
MNIEHDFPKRVGASWQFEFMLRFDGKGHVEIDLNRDYQLDFSIVECVERVARALNDHEDCPPLVGMSDNYLLNVAGDLADISRRLRALADPAKASSYCEHARKFRAANL